MSNRNVNVIQQIICAIILVNKASQLFTILCLFLIVIPSYSQEKSHEIIRDTTVRMGLKAVKFKAGTDITIKDKKIVVAGVLATDIDHSSVARRNVALKAGTKATFDEKGNVLSGTLKKINRSVSFNVPKSLTIRIEVMEDKNFSLYPDGSLKSGTLKDIYKFKLTPSGTISLFFTKGGEVTLRENGTIQSGYLNTNTNIKTADKYNYNFKGWCFAEFNEKGEIIKGVRIIGYPNERYTLDHIEVIKGKIYKPKNHHQCICAF